MTHTTNQLATTQLGQARTILNRLALGITVSTLLGACAWAQESANATGDLNAATPEVTYKFDNVVSPGDTFAQLLGINKNDTIAGYHGSGLAGHPDQGCSCLPNRMFLTLLKRK